MSIRAYRIVVRTRVGIDDDILVRARERAAEMGLSVSEVINRALREALWQHPARPAARWSMVTFGRGLLPSDHAPADFEAALDTDETARLIRG